MERLIQRVRSALYLDVPRDDIRVSLVRDGHTEEEVFLAMCAAVLLMKTTDNTEAH